MPGRRSACEGRCLPTIDPPDGHGMIANRAASPTNCSISIALAVQRLRRRRRMASRRPPGTYSPSARTGRRSGRSGTVTGVVRRLTVPAGSIRRRNRLNTAFRFRDWLDIRASTSGLLSPPQAFDPDIAFIPDPIEGERCLEGRGVLISGGSSCQELPSSNAGCCGHASDHEHPDGERQQSSGSASDGWHCWASRPLGNQSGNNRRRQECLSRPRPAGTQVVYYQFRQGTDRASYQNSDRSDPLLQL